MADDRHAGTRLTVWVSDREGEAIRAAWRVLPSGKPEGDSDVIRRALRDYLARQPEPGEPSSG